MKAMKIRKNCWCECHLASAKRWRAERKKRNAQANRLLIALIILANIPISLVESEIFRRFVNYLAPWYQVPWRKTFNKILDHTYISGQKFMKKELEGKTVSLTLDLATVLNSTRHFIVCSVHYLADRSSNIMKCCTLYVSQMTQRSTSADICRSLNTALVEFGVDVDQVISTCTDRGANVLKACKDLFGENKVTSCVCHLADNVVQDSLYSLPIVYALLKDVKQIAGFIKRSPTAANLLRTFQMQTGKTYSACLMPIQSVRTRWNSTLACIRRYIELHHHIKKVLSHPSLNSSKTKPPGVPDVAVASLSEMASVLIPFEELTKTFSSSTRMRSSAVVASIKGLILKIESTSLTEPVAKSLKEKLLLKLNEKKAAIEGNKVFCAANLVDPRYSSKQFFKILNASQTESK
ncbi:uncharacterized protein LOC135937113 [Cloeon dipterum]|uniref:uncharacterized protein LOC135937113 n=1 Tax=Cloeon dipterum TaxID=197152 RepID=UPI0032207BB1